MDQKEILSHVESHTAEGIWLLWEEHSEIV